jgi:hypothetical protein
MKKFDISHAYIGLSQRVYCDWERKLSRCGHVDISKQ